jgi:hypothetical protein
MRVAGSWPPLGITDNDFQTIRSTVAARGNEGNYVQD